MRKGQNIYLLGMSGHALSVIDALQSNGINPSGYFDQNKNKKIDIPFFGQETVDSCKKLLETDGILFPAVGSNKLRFKMVSFIESMDSNQGLILHSSAIISKTAVIDTSTFVSAGAIVNAYSKIGKGVIINTGVIVEHECKIADFVHLGPGTVFAGNVTVGEFTFIGANSTIKQGVSIGANVIIGAGSVVLSNIPNNTVFVGNPAKLLRHNE